MKERDRFCVCSTCYRPDIMRWEEHTDPQGLHGDCELCASPQAEHAFPNPIWIITQLLKRTEQLQHEKNVALASLEQRQKLYDEVKAERDSLRSAQKPFAEHLTRLGFRVVVDPNMPPDEILLRNSTGQEVRVTGLSPSNSPPRDRQSPLGSDPKIGEPSAPAAPGNESWPKPPPMTCGEFEEIIARDARACTELYGRAALRATLFHESDSPAQAMLDRWLLVRELRQLAFTKEDANGHK
jgi:hypothetical protein